MCKIFKTSGKICFIYFRQITKLRNEQRVTFAFEKLNVKMANRRPGDIEKIWADPSLANKELGWKTVSTIDDAMLTAWKWELELEKTRKK